MPYRILVVDDEADLAEALAEYLSRLGYQAETAADLTTMQAHLARLAADLVVLDLRLGAESGGAILADLVQNGGPPVIMISGHADLPRRIALLEQGAAAVMTKPVAPRELAARIEAVLRAQRPNDGHLIRFETAMADLASARLVHDDGQIDRLDAGEVALLRAFRDRAGKLLSRSDLLAAAPGASDEALERAIDNRISRLRAKIGTTAIVTVRGAGYRYDPAPPRPRLPD